MTDINSVVVKGRLVRDAEVKDVGDNKVLSFTIANNKGIKKNGEWTEEVSFFDCKVWNKNPERFVKGAEVVVSGELHQERWKDKEGHNASRVVINCGLIQYIGGKVSDHAASDQGQPEITW